MTSTPPTQPQAPWRRNGLWFGVIVAGMVCYGSILEARPDAYPNWEYVQDVLFEFHWFKGPIGEVKRWDQAITIEVFDQYGTNGALVHRVFDAFNNALEGTPIRLDLVAADGDIRLNIWGRAWTYAEESDEISGGYILVNSKRKESERYKTLIHEMFHVVAGANHASQRYDSIINKSDHS